MTPTDEERIKMTIDPEKIAELRRLLQELLDLQDSALSVDVRSRVIHAPEDKEVQALCERIGYGAVMDSAARQNNREGELR